jgi:hypothetical protein
MARKAVQGYHRAMTSATPSALGLPPEFGRDGSPPPPDSNFVVIADWKINENDLWDDDLKITTTDLPGGGSITKVERLPDNRWVNRWVNRRRYDPDVWQERPTAQKRAQYLQRWQRQDPPKQLPPGGSDAVTVSLKVGISRERANQVAGSLGVKYHALGAELSAQTTNKLTLSEEREVAHTVSLSNTTSDKYRRFAIWHIVNTIAIYKLRIDFGPQPLFAKPVLGSELLDNVRVIQKIEFISSDATNVSFIDVDPSR